MTWRDELRPASFRGVPFLVDSATTLQGQHADEQHFPGRASPGDAAHVEHLGIAPRRYRIDAFVVGESYHEQRDALEAALLEPGSGRLVHPYRGERVVSVVGTVATTESRQRGGFARVVFEVVETETPRLRRAPDTQAVVDRDLDAFLEQLEADFRSQYDTAGISPSFLSSSRDAFADATGTLAALYSSTRAGLGAVGSFSRQASRFVADLQRFSTAPFDAAEAYLRAVTVITSVPERLAQTALGLEGRGRRVVDALIGTMRPLIRFGELFVPIPPITANRRTEQRLRDATVQLVRGGALAATIRALAGLSYDSRAHAIAVRSLLVGELDDLIRFGSASGDTVSGARVHEALVDARAAMSAHLSRVARELPELDRYVVPSELPALVVAHLLYADARREAELVRRNAPPTPGLLPAGLTLEVLRG